MATLITSARLPIEGGVGTVGVTIRGPSGEAIARSTAGITEIATGDGFAIYEKVINSASVPDQGIAVWDDGDDHYGHERFQLSSESGGGESNSGGGILHAKIGDSSLAPDSFLEIIQGESKIVTFIVEADGRFDNASADDIVVKFRDPEGNVVTKNDEDIERVCEELDVQVIRVTLDPEDTEILEAGLMRIEIAFDTQKAVLTHSLKMLVAL